MSTYSLYQVAQERAESVGSHHLAFAAAKRGLDAAAPGTPAAAGYWLQLGDSAAAMGELELSYCLYARGWQQCCAAVSGAGGFFHSCQWLQTHITLQLSSGIQKGVSL